MNYQVLARKWRPKTFQALTGQEHVVRALTNALQQNRLHHAYLFTGTRGVGKTTLARILAKCLNCETGITATPCGACTACQEIDSGRFIDLIEIDAASRTKVEDTRRELLDNVPYAPTQGRYKVYLIDEVHMLSGHSFNALLKTLEEPPPHVKFLLATTDPQKLPATVLSRCLQFHLKNVPQQQIQTYLSHVLDQEQIRYEIEALRLIARAAKGSMRDALSLLDQAIAYGNNQLLTSEMHQLLGTFATTQLMAIFTALAKKDAYALFTAIAQAAEQGADFMQVLEELLALLHQTAITQLLPDYALENADENLELAKEFIQLFSPEELQLYYQIGLLGRRDLPFAPSLRAGFEMIILRMLAFRPVHLPLSLNTAASPISKPQAADTAGSANLPITKADASIAPKLPDKQAMPETSAVTAATSKTVTDTSTTPKLKLSEITNRNWPALLAGLGLTGAAYAIASECSWVDFANDEVNLCLKPALAGLLSDKQKAYITQAFCDYFTQPIKVKFTIAQTDAASPAILANSAAEQKQSTAQKAITEDKHVQALLTTFNATIIADSITPK